MFLLPDSEVALIRVAGVTTGAMASNKASIAIGTNTPTSISLERLNE